MGVDSSSPLLTKELSHRHIDLVAEVFQILKDAKGRPLSVEDVKQLGREPLQGYSYDDIEQALQDPALVGLAKKRDTRRYQIADPAQQVTKADVIYHMLEPPYKENKGAVESFLGKRRNERRIVLFGFVFLMACIPLLIWLLVSRLAVTITSTVMGGWIIAFFALMALGRYSSTRTWSKCQLSVERTLAVRLLNAYSDYRPFIADKKTDSLAKAGERVQEVALVLEGLGSEVRTAELTDWDTIRSQSERASKIGQELRTKVIPSIGKEEHSEKIGEILVDLARLLFEGSPEGMRQATELFKDRRFKDLPAKELPVSMPLGRAVLQRISHPIFMRFAVFEMLIVVGYMIMATMKGWQILGGPADYFGLVAASFAAYMFANVSQSGRGGKGD